LGHDPADIYGDFSAGLFLFDQGDLAGAAWEWRLSF
jgi:hypothetical protein